MPRLCRAERRKYSATRVAFVNGNMFAGLHQETLIPGFQSRIGRPCWLRAAGASSPWPAG